MNAFYTISRVVSNVERCNLARSCRCALPGGDYCVPRTGHQPSDERAERFLLRTSRFPCFARYNWFQNNTSYCLPIYGNEPKRPLCTTYDGRYGIRWVLGSFFVFIGTYTKSCRKAKRPSSGSDGFPGCGIYRTSCDAPSQNALRHVPTASIFLACEY